MTGNRQNYGGISATSENQARMVRRYFSKTPSTEQWPRDPGAPEPEPASREDRVELAQCQYLLLQSQIDILNHKEFTDHVQRSLVADIQNAGGSSIVVSDDALHWRCAVENIHAIGEVVRYYEKINDGPHKWCFQSVERPGTYDWVGFEKLTPIHEA